MRMENFASLIIMYEKKLNLASLGSVVSVIKILARIKYIICKYK